MAIPKELAKFGVTGAKQPTVRRLVAVAYGEPKVGKTSLMLRTAPRPLLILNIDRNLEPIEGKYADDDGIIVKDICVPRVPNLEIDRKMWEEVRDLYETATSKRLVRSVLLDTGDALRALLVRALVGPLEFGENGFSRKHGEVKSSLRWMFDQAKDCKINFLMTHRCEDEYAEGTSRSGRKVSQKTGKRVPAGWDGALYEAQMVVEMYKDDGESGAARYKAKIVSCNANPDVEGEVLSGDEVDWAALGTFACPWSEMEEWR